uniref:Uncharacterized protein n=1 Tax=Anguilla anguilla TaxID=7936 RepID=A0A0E9UBQ4_ANGAN
MCTYLMPGCAAEGSPHTPSPIRISLTLPTQIT